MSLSEVISRFGSKLLYYLYQVSTGVGTSNAAIVLEDLKDDHILDKHFDFPFENISFEGGGNKGMAYVGALRVSMSMQWFFLNSFLYATRRKYFAFHSTNYAVNMVAFCDEYQHSR